MWFFKVRPVRGSSSLGEFLAWCARIPELGGGPLDIDFAEEVHAAFGQTAEEALTKLKLEVYQ